LSGILRKDLAFKERKKKTESLILTLNILIEFGVGSLHAGGVGVATGWDKTILRSAAKRPLIRAKKDLELA